jgi:hypothetical protein
MINIIFHNYKIQGNCLTLKDVKKNIYCFIIKNTYIYISLHKYLYLVLLNHQMIYVCLLLLAIEN